MNNLPIAEFSDVFGISRAADFLKDFHYQPGHLVLSSYTMHDCYRFLIKALQEKEFRGFKEVDEQEAIEEHKQGHGSHSIDKIAPNLVRSIASAQETPTGERGNKLTNRQPHQKEGK